MKRFFKSARYADLKNLSFIWRTAIEGTYNLIFPVAMRLEDTPVPIPNTMVKIQAADGTMLETTWESRWLPEPFQEKS